MNALSAKDMVDLLVADRNYHIGHIHDSNTTFNYFVAATLISVAAGMLTKRKELHPRLFTKNNLKEFIFICMLSVVGYIFILWFGYEHTAIHAAQRERLERAIQYVAQSSDFSSAAMMKAFPDTVFSLYDHPFPKTVMLFAFEPDTRSFPFNHDQKWMLGYLLNIIALGWLGYLLFIRKKQNGD